MGNRKFVPLSHPVAENWGSAVPTDLLRIRTSANQNARLKPSPGDDISAGVTTGNRRRIILNIKNTHTDQPAQPEGRISNKGRPTSRIDATKTRTQDQYVISVAFKGTGKMPAHKKAKTGGIAN